MEQLEFQEQGMISGKVQISRKSKYIKNNSGFFVEKVKISRNSLDYKNTATFKLYSPCSFGVSLFLMKQIKMVVTISPFELPFIRT